MSTVLEMNNSGEIYTAGKNFTLPPAVTALTNFTSGCKWPTTQKCPLEITSKGETLLETRPDQEKGIIDLLHSGHWVLFWEILDNAENF